MGREIRRVIPNWEHPRDDNGRYQPMMDSSYKDAIGSWIKEHEMWEQGAHPDQKKDYRYYADYGGDAPEAKYYHPDWDEKDMTWYQMYETVSEGTPVTPPFEHEEELVEYLTKHGTFWNPTPWRKEQAQKFVGIGWMMSGIMTNGGIYTGKEIMDIM